MWPMLLNMTRDECRRTLRTLELEAYSNMISVFRAQGALEDNRKKLLEELRAVLHISHDRHSAEARRVSNDELLATIAEQLAGPNTGLGWISEGRRRVPLLPRGVAQTMYTEIADKAAEAAAEENKQILKKIEADKLVAPKTEEEETAEAEGETAEGAVPSSDMSDEQLYPPVAMEDQTAKLWETELICRKRKVPEGSAIPGDAGTPTKNMRNIPANTNQKHLNLSQYYSKFSQPATSKSTSQSKHSYNQVSKVSTSKSNQSHTQTTPHKHRSHKRSKNPAPIIVSKSQVKKPQEIVVSPSKYSQVPLQQDYAGPPNTFQASYAQAVLGGKSKQEFSEEMKQKALPGVPLAATATAAHELNVSDTTHTEDPATLQAQATSTPNHNAKPCHLIIKNKPDVPTDKKVQIIKKQPSEGVKVISNKQVVLTAGGAKAVATPNKLITKVVGSVGKRGPNAPVMGEKMIVVSKPDSKPPPNSKIIITSSVTTMPTPARAALPLSSQIASPRPSEAFTPKGIPAPDLKVSAKTVVLNPKSGQKMVVLPAKARTKSGSEGPIPVLPYFKGITTAMKLVPVSSQTLQASKSTPVTVVSKPAVVNTIPPKKIIGVEPIKTANLADIVPVKGMAPTTPKITNPIVRPVSKGNVIVVPKGATLGKALTFTKNGNDMSKIIMGKNVNQLLQAKPEQAEKCPGNVIVLELNNEQSGRPTTMSEILENRGGGGGGEITADTPVLFDACAPEAPKESAQEAEAKDSSSTDWEMELDTAKEKDDKLNALHLDLGMSSDDDGDHKRDNAPTTPSGVYASGLSMATRTLLSQLQDDGSSSNDSSFALRRRAPPAGAPASPPAGPPSPAPGPPSPAAAPPAPDAADSEALSKARERLSEKVARSRQKRIDVYSTAISSADINLDSFSYLEEDLMAGDDDDEKDKGADGSLHDQLARLLK